MELGNCLYQGEVFTCSGDERDKTCAVKQNVCFLILTWNGGEGWCCYGEG